MIYLDYAAATPMDPDVYAAMQPYATERFFNPSATYLAAQSIHRDIEAARGRLAHWLGARSSEIVFTAGGTEANNLAIRGILEQFPDGNIVVSGIEHESVLATAQQYDCREAVVGSDGIVDVDALMQLIDDSTVLVSVMYANNEIGTVQPIRKIAAALQMVWEQRRAAGNTLPVYLHTDAAQAAPYLDLHAARLGVDLMTINAGKIYGPKQVGALYIASSVQVQPQVSGGGQERGLRSGTENVMGVIGLAAALDIVQERRHDEVHRLQQLQQLFFNELEQAIPGVVINGSRKMRLPNNVHITIPGADNERLIFQLDGAGILCAAGSACSADKGEPSHVLRAMGLSDAAARASLRFTTGRQTTEDDIRTTVEKLKQFTT
jgi:cysteine desulfurase